MQGEGGDVVDNEIQIGENCCVGMKVFLSDKTLDAGTSMHAPTNMEVFVFPCSRDWFTLLGKVRGRSVETHRSLVSSQISLLRRKTGGTGRGMRGFKKHVTEGVGEGRGGRKRRGGEVGERGKERKGAQVEDVRGRMGERED
eukprot:328637-Hanusia_phi.AAC.2